MIKKILFLLLLISQLLLRAQFNNIYLNDLSPYIETFALKENSFTGQYLVAMIFFNPQLETNYLGIINVSQDGNLDSIKIVTDYSSPAFFGSGQSFIKLPEGEFLIGGNFDDSLFLQRFDHNLDTVWNNIQPSEPAHFWGGGELSNGDLIMGLAFENPANYHTMKVNRYSSAGEFLNFFNVELDYDFTYPSTFITKDSLVYISFPRLLLGEYRRNYIVCYNAITGQELWETHQIENDQALGFTDGFLCMTSDGQLKFVFVEQVELDVFETFDGGYQGYFKVSNIDPQTGEMSGETVFSGQETQSRVIDVAACTDGGLVVLFQGDNLDQPEFSFYGIMKLNNEMEVEWRNLYYQPLDLEIGENGSYLIELETTSDDCIVAVGNAQGIYFPEQEVFRYPWVLKVDACGNEMVSDCTLSGIGELSQEQTITIYPNPARNRIFLKGENTIQRAMIYDLKGQLVHDEHFSGSLQQTLFIDHLPTGLYVVKAMTNEGEWSSERIMVCGEYTR